MSKLRIITSLISAIVWQTRQQVPRRCMANTSAVDYMLFA